LHQRVGGVVGGRCRRRRRQRARRSRQRRLLLLLLLPDRSERSLAHIPLHCVNVSNANAGLVSVHHAPQWARVDGRWRWEGGINSPEEEEEEEEGRGWRRQRWVWVG